MFYRGKPDFNNIFIELYKAFPATVLGRMDLENSNSICLPPSALIKLTNMGKAFNQSNPIIFRIMNIELNIFTHWGVIDFTAEEGTCYLPFNIFDKLCLNEGQPVNLRNVELKKGTYIKIRPHKTELLDQGNQRVILEYCLRSFFCVTEGDTISIEVNKKAYDIDIVKCKPERAVMILNCNVEVDFDAPKDHKEPPKENNRGGVESKNSGNIKFNSTENTKRLTSSEIKRTIEDEKFSGHHTRMDGKDITKKFIDKIKKNKEIHDAEENYDPRKSRIECKPRLNYHYVEL